VSPKTVQFSDFSGGLNRTAARQRMKDSQLYMNENAQSIGPGQLQTLGPPNTSITTIAQGIATFHDAGLKLAGAEVRRIITVNQDGSMSSVDPQTGATVAICGAGTVTTKARFTVWNDTPLLIVDPTHGYFSWDGTTFLSYPHVFTGDTHTTAVVTNIGSTAGFMPGMHVAGAGVPVGTTILSVDSPTQITLTAPTTSTVVGDSLTIGLGAPTSASDIQVFEGRACLLTGPRLITATAPGSFTDFQTADGAVNIPILDSIFSGAITRLLSALELLWIVGPSAVNAVSNLQTGGTPLATTFSNTNIVANVGSILPSSVEAFFRTFIFLAPYGVYAIVGATPQKLSDDLDGLFSTFLSFGTDQPAAVFTVNQVFCWGVLVTYKDPVLGSRPVVLVFARNAWFLASQGLTSMSLTWVSGVLHDHPELGKIPHLWGTDGTHLFECFEGDGAEFHQIQFKLWDFGQFTTRKQMTKLAVEFSSNEPITTTVSAETESASIATSITAQGNRLRFIGAGGVPIQFIGAGAQPLNFVSGGVQIAWGSIDGVAGNYLSVKVAGTSQPFTLSALAMEIDPMGEWTIGPVS